MGARPEALRERILNTPAQVPPLSHQDVVIQLAWAETRIYGFLFVLVFHSFTKDFLSTYYVLVYTVRCRERSRDQDRQGDAVVLHPGAPVRTGAPIPLQQWPLAEGSPHPMTGPCAPASTQNTLKDHPSSRAPMRLAEPRV